MKNLFHNAFNIGFKQFLTLNHILRNNSVENLPKLDFHIKNDKNNKNIKIFSENSKNLNNSNKSDKSNISNIQEMDNKQNNNSILHNDNDNSDNRDKISIKIKNEINNPNSDELLNFNKQKIEEKKLPSENKFEFEFDLNKLIDKEHKLEIITDKSKIPSSSLSRGYNVSKLGISIFTSAFGNNLINKITGSNKENKSIKDFVLSESNSEKISKTLRKMRGAALKFGQILSTFEDVIIPEPLLKALEKARKEANAMPHSQLLNTLSEDLGEDWEKKFIKFDKEPFASASIGQVHKAEVKDIGEVAVKIQFPGVAQSVDSDLKSIKNLFSTLNIVPKGLFIDKLVDNLGKELKDECDYQIEANKQKRYRIMVENCDDLKEVFYVPKVIDELTNKNIITAEFIKGLHLDQISHFPQEIKDYIGEKLLLLCLKELFHYKFMQTDPNPANFYIFRDNTNKFGIRIGLIDFGAAREYSDSFIDIYSKIIYYGSKSDRSNVIKYSIELGFLTGLENEIMLDAHCRSVFAIAAPFKVDENDVFDFGNQNITSVIYKDIPVMLKNRLTSPPSEIYSLHRRLSGTYLSCIEMKSKVRSGKIFKEVFNNLQNKKI